MATLFQRSNGIYYVVDFQDGRRIWKSTRTKTYKEARQFLRRYSALPIAPAAPPPSKTTFEEFGKTFLEYAEANLAPTTVMLYRAAIKTFIRLITNKSIERYSTLDIERFKALRVKEVSASKVNIDFACLKAMFHKAQSWGCVSQSPCSGVKLIRIPPRRPIFLTEPQFGALLSTVEEFWFKELLVFAVSTMMRAGEICSLTWESVDLAKRVILVENTAEHRLKTTQPHGVPMNDLVYQILIRRESRSGYVFPNPRGGSLKVDHLTHKFKKQVIRAGLPLELHFHSLRHTGASWLVQGGVSIYAVQKILGHSDIKVTMMYSHLVTSEMHDCVNTIKLPSVVNM